MLTLEPAGVPLRKTLGTALLVQEHGQGWGGGGGVRGHATDFWANQWQTTHFSKIADCSEVNSFNDIVCPIPPVGVIERPKKMC